MKNRISTHPEEYFYWPVNGDSMAPHIEDGDRALVHKQPSVESGQLAVVAVGGEDWAIRKIVKGEDGITLQPFNPAYEPRVIEAGKVTIAGLVVETERFFVKPEVWAEMQGV